MKHIFTIIFSLLLICSASQAQDSRDGSKPFLKSVFNSSGKKKESVNVTLRDGSVYTGELRRKRPHGNGSVQYANGDKYCGTFLDGYRHGSGSRVIIRRTKNMAPVSISLPMAANTMAAG